MNAGATRGWVADEARALLARASRVRPLLTQETMLPAATPEPRTQRAIETALRADQQRVIAALHRLLRWLATPAASRASGAELQAELIGARMHFNDALHNYDLFADAITQRSERDIGVWLAGLDAAAEDVIALPGYYEPPPVLCYLDRGPGAAIRRARTRLPGGGDNPVALIQIPRERMTGGAIAASLAHETGHQAAALLELIESLRRELAGRETWPWPLWHRWISEIVADLWAVARLGTSGTIGLIGVLALPAYFVYRIAGDDPHPPPWLRVKLSVAFGQALYPDGQWAELEALWHELYPLGLAGAERAAALEAIAAGIPALRDTVLAHRCPALAPVALGAAIAVPGRAPAELSAMLGDPTWRAQLTRLSPSHALAVIGQARWMRAITPEDEADIVGSLLARWAVRRSDTESTH